VYFLIKKHDGFVSQHPYTPCCSLVFNCLQSGEEAYDEQFHTDDKAKDDAEFIYKKGQGKWGTDESSIFKVLCAAPPQYLQKINTAYTEKYDVTLFHALEKELSGNVKDGTVHMLGMKLRYVPQRIHRRLKGDGTHIVAGNLM
jgi:Annexin